jgi:MYXO-CTERM domain-containing protein
MARMRKLSAALFLVPMTLVAGHTASAAPRNVATGSAASAVVAALPAGVHARRDGRYTIDNCDHSKAHYCFSKTLLPREWQPGQPVPKHVVQGNGGGLTPGGMGPSDVLTAYKIPSNANAGGRIVAILDSADSFAFSDLTEYRATYGLPALPKCSGMPTGTSPCFAQVSQTGGASSGQDSGQEGDAETSLDMDMISAACPDCSILLVEIGDTQGDFSDDDFIAGAQTAAKLGAVATSISIGGPEGAGPGGQGGADPTGYTTPGHLVLAASGDFGYDLIDEGANIGTPSYPASAPDVLAVGGTTLFSSGASYDEAVWNDGTFATNQNGQDVTTSGCSTEFAGLSWQAASLSGSGCTNRATADVSAAAAFVSGGQLADIAVYVQGWTAVEGTSASSPMMAGMLTRLGLAEIISNNLGWPYANPTGWNDLGSTAYPVDSSGSSTDSSDPSKCGKLCSVAAGWDGPSGLGTPNGSVLASLAGLPQPPPGIDAGSPTSGTGTGGTGTGTGGTGTLPGSGGGAQQMGTASDPGSLGASCDGPTDCESGLCAKPNPAGAAVCTTPCGSACLIGFACTEGYCFPGPAFTSAATQNNNNNDGDSGGSGSSGGCSVSSSTASSWAGLGWLSVGLFAAARRRRQARES